MADPTRDPSAALEASRARMRVHFLSTATQSAVPGKVWWTSLPFIPPWAAALMGAASALVPMAKRHPVRLVVCAAAVGAAIAWIRPWRWVTAAVVAASLAKAVDLLTQAPSKDNAWSDFMDFVLQKKGPPQR